MNTFEVKKFEDLKLSELYNILKIRQEVFVVEQNCVYLDADGKDKVALHCCLLNDQKEILAYTRLFNVGGSYDYHSSIGRVLVNPIYRKCGYGKEIMQYSIDFCLKNFNNSSIKIGAQRYLDKFYNELGFESINDHYIEDGIPHQSMVYKPKI